MSRLGPLAFLGLACFQVVLIAAVPAQVGHQAAAPPMVAAASEEGWSLLVDRIADSPYGLMDPVVWPEDQLPPEQQQPVLIYTSYTPEQQKAQMMLPMAPEEVRQLIQLEANQVGVDPLLIESIVRNESGFNAQARSPVGAIGLMQLMPGTAASLGVDPYHPGQNVNGGVRYFSQQLQRYGDVGLALAAYNAGPGAVDRYGGIPPYAETVNYVDRVMSDYRAARGFP